MHKSPKLFVDGENSDSTRVSKRCRSQSRPWPNELTKKLIKAVEEHEELWNPFQDSYKNFKATRLTWNDISKKLGRSSEDCTNKWGALRSNFKSRFVNKITSEESGGVEKELPEPYCRMKFLVGVFSNKPQLRVTKTGILESEDNTYTSDSQSFVLNKEDTIDAISTDLHYTPTPGPAPPTKRRRMTVKNSSPTSLSTPLQRDDLLGLAFERIAQQDEWDKTALNLAEHMRNTVREFPLLADEFRMKLLEAALDVQKARSSMRAQESQSPFKSENLYE